MGLFSSVGKIVGKVAGPVLNVGAGYLSGGLGGALDAGASYVNAQQAYNQTREGAEQQNTWAREAAERAQVWSAKEAEKNRWFQKNAQWKAYDLNKKTYQKRYQWQMDDMRKAGLSPILAYQTGAPGGPQVSGVPGAQGQAFTYRPENVESRALDAVNSASANYRMRTEQRQMRETMKRLNQDTKTGAASEDMLKQDAMKRHAEGLESHARSHVLSWTAERAKHEAEIAKLRVSNAKAAASASAHDEAFWKTPLGKVLRWVDRAGTSINPFASSAKTLKGLE